MVRSVADVEKALLDKGMERDESHHHMFRKEIEGVTQIVTRISHSAKQITDHHAGLMGKQCYLQLKEFWNLVDCPLSEEEWDGIVRERCVDGRNPLIGR